ncbi:MAG: substrate-binding domain-containing protein [Pirellulales bacterium]|nr:substrate-binding domain-containing protein [Pirellulales bacterium]
MFNEVIRIALVFQIQTAYTRRLAAGASRYARPGPDQGPAGRLAQQTEVPLKRDTKARKVTCAATPSVTREFVLGEALAGLPSSYEMWNPDAAISFIAAEEENLFAAIAAGGRPVVNTSLGKPRPGFGVVSADPDSLYNAIVRHFTKIGIRHIYQFIIGISPGGKTSSDNYRLYAKTHKIKHASFTLPEEPENFFNLDRIQTIDAKVAEWLCSLPKPAGIFSQQIFSGPYLCHACRLLHLAVPDQVAIIGTDGFDVALRSTPPLTTVHLPAEEIGYKAAKLVIEMLNGRPAPTEAIRVPGAEVIPRASTIHRPHGACDIPAALAFIEDHACDGITVGDVVSHTQGVTRMTFYTRFVETTGIQPAAAIKERKLAEARRLLAETKISIAAISEMCGYSNELYFSQVFRKAEGVPPSAYRKMQFAME